jgi:hypothetical protein
MNRRASFLPGRVLGVVLLVSPGCASTVAPAKASVAHEGSDAAHPKLTASHVEPCRGIREASAASASVNLLWHWDDDHQLSHFGASLNALAGAIRAIAPDDPTIAAWAEQISQDAALLEGADEVDRSAPARTKDGLLTSVAAIERLATARGMEIGAWTGTARAAALAIDPSSMLVFQRARAQEAFRSAADALLVVVRGCESPTTVPLVPAVR